jgi:major vault protein
MVVLNPYSYCVIHDPVITDDAGKALKDKHDQVMLKHGDSEVRIAMDYEEPFPLYPGEKAGKFDSIPVIPRDHALK